MMKDHIEKVSDPYYGLYNDEGEYSPLMQEGILKAREAYAAEGYSLSEIADNREENPLTMDDFVDNGVIDYVVESMFRRGGPNDVYPSFLQNLGITIQKDANYEANYLDALMKRWPKVLEETKNQVFNRYMDWFPNAEHAWEMLQLNPAMGGTR